MLVRGSVLLLQGNVRLHSSLENQLGKLFKVTTPVASLRIQRPNLYYPNVEFEWPYPNFKEPQRLWKFTSAIACFTVGLFGKTMLSVINTTKFNNLPSLREAIFRRSEGVPLITVSNHESCMDDPCLIGAIMTNLQLCQQSKMRWGLAAHDICYRKPWHGWIMSRGKCAPVVRGMGVYQKSVDFIIQRLNEGNWLHIFPEGKVNMERQGLHRLKWGIGRIISELETTPIVIPFWHIGMQNVLPNTRPYYPRIGKKVFVNVGDPIDLSSILKKIEDKTALEKRKLITDIIQAEMEKLRRETIELAKTNGITCDQSYT